MSYFRKTPKLLSQLDVLKRDQKWLILINADPDAMAAAAALRRIMSTRAGAVDVAHINEISRPDNLAMILYTRLHMQRYRPELRDEYSHFALVDSQPAHSPLFGGIGYSLIIDHHPPVTEPAPGLFTEILPEYGATSTIFTEYLYNLGLRPGRFLATALQFGIKTDTMNFQRHVSEVDLRGYMYLNKFADQTLLSRIVRSEFHLNWLPQFAKATTNLRKAGKGHFIYIGKVDNPDILVVIADFFTRVYEIRWLVVSGYYESRAVLIFRGDGLSNDMGRLANVKFNGLGSGGGHRSMARAEFDMAQAEGEDLERFIYNRLVAPLPRKKPGPPAGQNEPAEQTEPGGKAPVPAPTPADAVELVG
ncbi:MAG: phosphoesterase [Deltaproteobacteria bacterium]|jgi:nanoRNase/pAp phosphatase (c-di-AMP/oligoRNAs hydrolase)|nr:phosphoesterase [Deltaproteobacteria bacterium]